MGRFAFLKTVSSACLGSYRQSVPPKRWCSRSSNVLLPSEYRKLAITTLTPKFRDAVKVLTVPLEEPGPRDIVLKTSYSGVNASDVNVAAGRYFVSGNPPYDVGFEAVGHVVSTGTDVKNINIGDAVATFEIGSFAEYLTIPAKRAFPIPSSHPEAIGLLTGGLTASLGLDKQGRIQPGDKVLITAAAGGVGHIAVQWAKAAGCHVIGTCSSQEKGEFLKNIGCDRVINYKTEKLGEVLKKEYPKGVDVIWETIGGKTFETLLKRMSVKGRLVIVGAITGYQSNEVFPEVNLSGLPLNLLMHSASIGGFFVPHYEKDFPEYLQKMMHMLQQGTLKVQVDLGMSSPGGMFEGLEGAIRAVEYLHTGKSKGKVVVRFE